MGEPTLVIRAADLDAMELALTNAHTALLEETREAMSDATTLTAGWDPDSESRIAERAYAGRVSASHTALMSRLALLRTDIATVRENARQCEIRCVAILD